MTSGTRGAWRGWTAATVPSDAATLHTWGLRWRAIQRQAYQELVASYTPEQREVIRRMTEAKRQARLCRERARWPEGSQGTHPSECAWPEEPPTE